MMNDEEDEPPHDMLAERIGQRPQLALVAGRGTAVSLLGGHLCPLASVSDRSTLAAGAFPRYDMCRGGQHPHDQFRLTRSANGPSPHEECWPGKPLGGSGPSYVH